jgi:hypothetical protein
LKLSAPRPIFLLEFGPFLLVSLLKKRKKYQDPAELRYGGVGDTQSVKIFTKMAKKAAGYATINSIDTSRGPRPGELTALTNEARPKGSLKPWLFLGGITAVALLGLAAFMAIRDWSLGREPLSIILTVIHILSNHHFFIRHNENHYSRPARCTKSFLTSCLLIFALG